MHLLALLPGGLALLEGLVEIRRLPIGGRLLLLRVRINPCVRAKALTALRVRFAHLVPPHVELLELCAPLVLQRLQQLVPRLICQIAVAQVELP